MGRVNRTKHRTNAAHTTVYIFMHTVCAGYGTLGTRWNRSSQRKHNKRISRTWTIRRTKFCTRHYNKRTHTPPPTHSDGIAHVNKCALVGTVGVSRQPSQRTQNIIERGRNVSSVPSFRQKLIEFFTLRRFVMRRRRRRQILVKNRSGESEAKTQKRKRQTRSNCVHLFIFFEKILLFMFYLLRKGHRVRRVSIFIYFVFSQFGSARLSLSVWVRSVASANVTASTDDREQSIWQRRIERASCALTIASCLPVTSLRSDKYAVIWTGLGMGAFSSWSVFIAHKFTYFRVEWTAHEEWMRTMESHFGPWCTDEAIRATFICWISSW